MLTIESFLHFFLIINWFIDKNPTKVQHLSNHPKNSKLDSFILAGLLNSIFFLLQMPVNIENSTLYIVVISIHSFLQNTKKRKIFTDKRRIKTQIFFYDTALISKIERGEIFNNKKQSTYSINVFFPLEIFQRKHSPE